MVAESSRHDFGLCINCVNVEGEEEGEEEERRLLSQISQEVTCSRNGKQLTYLRTCETPQICSLENYDSLLEHWSNCLEHPVKMGVSMIVSSAIAIYMFFFYDILTLDYSERWI